MSRKAVLIAVIFLVSTLGLLVTPAVAQPPWRVYGWGAVTRYVDLTGDYDASGGLFFSVRGHEWIVWAYFRHPDTNELWYIRAFDLWDYDVYPPGGMHCHGDWYIYIDWVYKGTLEAEFEIVDWRRWDFLSYAGPFIVEGMVMFSRVRPYYIFA